MNIFKDIKQCPFCGSKVEAHYASYGDGVLTHFSAHCCRCGFIDITTVDDDTEPRLDAYFDVWQRRPPDDEDDHK